MSHDLLILFTVLVGAFVGLISKPILLAHRKEPGELIVMALLGIAGALFVGMIAHIYCVASVVALHVAWPILGAGTLATTYAILVRRRRF